MLCKNQLFQNVFKSKFVQFHPNYVMQYALFRNTNWSIQVHGFNIFESNLFLISTEIILVTDSLSLTGPSLFSLNSSTIYGIKQEYLIKACPADESSTLYYNRIYEAKDSSVNSDKYTIFHTTSMWNFYDRLWLWIM